MKKIYDIAVPERTISIDVQVNMRSPVCSDIIIGDRIINSDIYLSAIPQRKRFSFKNSFEIDSEVLPLLEKYVKPGSGIVNSFYIETIVESWTRRYRKLYEFDEMELEQMDTLSLAELSYVEM